MLTYKRSGRLEVTGYSASGFIFMMAGGAVSWKSVKQTLTELWKQSMSLVMRLLAKPCG